MFKDVKRMTKIPRIMIAGTHSGVGKTIVTLGIMSILCEKGYKVQGFKCGPDYIDVSHHSVVTGNMSRNLDTWMMEDEVCMELFYRSAAKAQISIIEGVMGLYDGSLSDSLSNVGKGSSAHMSSVLKTPIILVIDAKGTAQSAGAIALGFEKFSHDVEIRGVILNRIGSKRHFEAVKSSIECSTNLRVVGYLPKNKDFVIPERHLGLIPSVECENIREFYKEIGKQMETTISVDKIIEIADSACDFPQFNEKVFGFTQRNTINEVGGESNISRDCLQFRIPNSKLRVKMAVAMDEAFHFYYHDNLDLFKELGMELIFFSLLNDNKLPSGIAGIYIGGGFPELFASGLEANENMRHAVKAAAKDGIIIYAECGGLMYLSDKLVDCVGKPYIMVGVFPVGTEMQSKRHGLGYINVRAEVDTILCKKGDTFRAHEFHWSSLIGVENLKSSSFAYKISKSDSNSAKSDGLFNGNVLASYAHVHFASNPELAINLVKSMRSV